MEARPTVFITNAVREHKYEDAERFGKRVIVTQGYVDLKNTKQLVRRLLLTFSDANENDILLISGITLVNVLCLVVWTSMFDIVNLLIYDGTSYKLESYDQEKILELMNTLSSKEIVTDGKLSQTGEIKKDN